MRTLLVGGLAAAVLAAPPAGAADLRAEQITRETAAELIIGGTQAAGGIGDWYLANDVVEIIVDDPSRRTGHTPYGGNPIDAGLRDRRDEDQLSAVVPVVNLSQHVLVPYDRIRAEVNEAEGWARLVVSMSGGLTSVPQSVPLANRLLVPAPEDLRPVQITTEYKVLPGEPYVHVTTTMTNRGSRPAPVFAFSDVVLRENRSMRAFLGDTLAPDRARGYHHASFDPTQIVGSDGAISGFTFLSLPGVRQYPPIAYALCAPERVRQGLPSYGVTDEAVSVSGILLRDPTWDAVSTARLMLARGEKLPPGKSWTYHRLFVVAGRPDVASTTDILFPLLGYADGSSGVTGRVAPADVPHVIHVKDARTGAPVTQISPPPEGPDAGSYRTVLPPGKYTLEFRAPQRPTAYQEIVVRVDTFADAGTKRLADPGWLLFDPAFVGGGAGKVIVQGHGDTPDPVFDPELLDFRVDANRPGAAMETNSLYFVGNRTDPRRVAVAPGSYRLIATRGLEHGIATTVVTVPAAGAEVRVSPFQPPRVLDLARYVTADFHVHSEASGDSSVSNETRVRTFVADDLDVLTSTEHDTVGNFEAALDAVGVRDRLRVIHGTEVTGTWPSPRAPFTIGHSNVWPTTFDPLASYRGAPPSENVTLAEMYETARHDHGVEVVQLNHPVRWSGAGLSTSAYFTHLGDAGEPFDPDVAITEWPNSRLLEPAPGGTRAVDFDAIEVMNGAGLSRFMRMRPLWYGLIEQGFRRTGTANSDTHQLQRAAGYPRNYVRYAPGPGGWDTAAFNAAVRAGRLFGTSGPLILRFTANGGEMGDTVTATDGVVKVAMTAAAAPWVPVDEVRLVVNGAVHDTFGSLPGLDGAPVVRLEREVTLHLERDSFLTLEAGVPLLESRSATLGSPGGVYAAVAGRDAAPIAFTNPIFIDVDGNGRFDGRTLPRKPAGWFSVNIPLYVFGAVIAVMLIAMRIARRKS